MRRAFGVGAALAVLMLSNVAWAEQVSERHTSTNFQVRKNIGGAPHVLVGVGARRAAGMINVYGAGMYVGAKAGAAAWQSYLTGRFAKAGLVSSGTPNFQKLPSSAPARHYMVYGLFPKAIDMAFVRDVRADQVTGAYEESWDRVNLDRTKAGTALTEFMAAVNHPMSSGQRMMIRTSGNRITVSMPGGTTNIAGNRAMVIAIWKIWFGNPCLQAPLRNGMLSNLQRIHDEATGG